MANERLTIFPLASRTVEAVSEDFENYECKGLHLIIKCEAVFGSGVITLQGKDEVSDTYYTIGAAQTITASGVTVVKVYPGLTTGGTVYNDVLPSVFRVIHGVTPGSGVAVTLSVGANLIA